LVVINKWDRLIKTKNTFSQSKHSLTLDIIKLLNLNLSNISHNQLCLIQFKQQIPKSNILDNRRLNNNSFQSRKLSHLSQYRV
jgi:hypothetical protein